MEQNEKDINDIKKYLKNRELDCRKNYGKRWIDQKCTFDVVKSISKVIKGFADANSFTSREIHESSIFIDEVEDQYQKADASNLASNEYDKFIDQPLQLLDYAGVIKGNKEGTKYTYKVIQQRILEYIALSNTNSLDFIVIYLEEVLRQSDLWSDFETFFEEQTSQSLLDLKKKFETFLGITTKIRNKKEKDRIFPKVLNPLAFRMKKKGVIRGYISKFKIGAEDLYYNRKNFRDLDKEKDITRQEYRATLSEKEIISAWDVKMAKDKVKTYNEMNNDGLSELRYLDSSDDSQGAHVHHILMASQYPEFKAYTENLVAISATEHLEKAHPMGHTQEVDRKYQKDFLKVKLIEMEKGDPLVNKHRLIEIINKGFGKSLSPDASDREISDCINDL